MEEQQNLVKLAKQGDTKALTALMNHSLQTKGITVKINLTNDCFMVIAESAEPPEQSFLVDFVRQGIKNLNTEVIKRVIIRGHATGQTVPAWREALDLDPNISVKQVQISKSINNGVSKRETFSQNQSRIQFKFLNKILNLVQENRQFERLALVITTFLLTSSVWAIVGFRNSILLKADSSIAPSLLALNKNHTIQGNLTLKEMELGVSTGGYCSGKEGYQDIEQGGDIAIKNSKGEIIGNASLTAGKYIDVEESLSSEAEKAKWKELNASRDLPSAFFCRFDFTVENIPETNFYFIEIGHRKGPTYSLEDMNNKGWKMNLTLGK